MIKLSRETAVRVLTAFRYFLRMDPNTLDTVASTVVRAAENEDPLTDAGRILLDYAESINAVDLEQDIELLASAFQGQASTPGEITLIEKLVDILQQPFALQRLQGEGLKKLQKVMLTTEEKSKLGGLEIAELRCIQCGRDFEVYEGATLMNAGSGKFGFACFSCRTPMYQSCAKKDCTAHPHMVADVEPILCQEHQAELQAQVQVVTEGEAVPIMPPMEMMGSSSMWRAEAINQGAAGPPRREPFRPPFDVIRGGAASSPRIGNLPTGRRRPR